MILTVSVLVCVREEMKPWSMYGKMNVCGSEAAQ